MKLYEAMLKGAKQGPQVFGEWSNGGTGTCAMGAVMLGCGFQINSHDWYDGFVIVRNLYPELGEPAECPISSTCRHCDGFDPSLMDVIMHLNDKHEWSRQRIAEWLSGTKVTEAKPVYECVGSL